MAPNALLSVLFNTVFLDTFNKPEIKTEISEKNMALEEHKIATFSTISLLAMILNAFEIAALLHAKRTKLPFDITLISLAVSDLIVALAVILFTILHLTQTSKATSELYGKVYAQVIFAFGLSSIFHMIFIALQRLVAVLFPLKLSIWMTRKRCIIAICVLWLISIAASIPVYHIWCDYEKGALYTPLVSASAIMLCYVVISYRVMTRRRLTATGISSQNLHVLLYSMTVTTIYIVCSIPLMIEKLIHGCSSRPFYATCLSLLQMMLNPVAYFLFHYLKEKKFEGCCRTQQIHDGPAD